MQYVDDDMDDLFRRAAENYPLRVVTKDWDEICPAAPAALPMVSAERKKQYSSALLLTLVFLAIGITVMFVIGTPGVIAVQNNVLQNKPPSSSKILTGEMTQLIPVAPVRVAKRQLHLLGARQQIHNNDRAVSQREIAEYKNINTGADEAFNTNETSATSLPNMKPVVFSMEVIPYKSALLAIKVNKKESPSVIAAATIKTEISKKNNNARLYFKMEAGLQSNQVQSQGFGKSGISVGLFTGYLLNRHLSVETGIEWSKKYFFTDAKYFDMSKAGSGMPANMMLISLKSRSNIFEIPVSLRYKIHQNNASTLSIAAGISSFIYSSESNDYLALVNGQQQMVQGKYTNHKSYFSAAAQFGVGYEYHLNKRTHLNFEPYIQVPLKGIGIGQVQLMTAGLHISITRFTRH